jgi:hypothetical protein
LVAEKKFSNPLGCAGGIFVGTARGRDD